MAKKQLINPIYKKYASRVLKNIMTLDFYEYFIDVLSNGKNKFQFSNRKILKSVDEKWVIAIENAIRPLEEVINNPRNFIMREELVVNIGLAKKITPDSVRHLAQHGEMIDDWDSETNKIRPNRIQQTYKEDSWNTYENRFVYTLLEMTWQFIDKRYEALFAALNEEYGAYLKMQGESHSYQEGFKYNLDLRIQQEEDLLSADEKNESIFARIARLHRIIGAFRNTAFAKEMSKYQPVKPPLVPTNAIKKNPNYKACHKLWNFILSYDDIGYKIDIVEQSNEIDEDFATDIFNSVFFNYVILKNHLEDEEDRVIETDNQIKKRSLKPKFIKEIIEEIVKNYDIPDVEIRKVLIEEMTKADLMKEEKDERRRLVEEKEKEMAEKRKFEEREAKERAKAEEKERKRLEKERLAEEKRLEKERIAEEKRLQKEKEQKEADDQAKAERFALMLKQMQDDRIAIIQKRLIEKEKAEKAAAEEAERLRKLAEAEAERKRIEEQKAAEKARIAAEAEAERKRIAAEKQAERERIAKEKSEAKAKAEAEKQAEKERIAKEKAKAKAKAEAERIAEKERAAAERAKAKAKAKIEADKAKAKAKTEAEKAKAKAKAEAEKQAEKERIAKEKAEAKAKAEAERIAEKERAAAERAKAKVKARIEADKAKAKAKTEAEKAKAKAKAEAEKQAEKERIAKEKAEAKAKVEAERIAEKERAAAERAKAKVKAKIEADKAKAKAKTEAEKAKAKAKAEAEKQAEKERIAEEKAKAKAKAEAEKAKAKAKAKAEAEKAKAKAKAEAEKIKAKEKAETEKAEVKANAKADNKRIKREVKQKDLEAVENRIKGQLGGSIDPGDEYDKRRSVINADEKSAHDDSAYKKNVAYQSSSSGSYVFDLRTIKAPSFTGKAVEDRKENHGNASEKQLTSSFLKQVLNSSIENPITDDEIRNFTELAKQQNITGYPALQEDTYQEDDSKINTDSSTNAESNNGIGSFFKNIFRRN